MQICYLHLSIDDFKADLMNYDQETDEYSILRMVPPRRIEYYFSVSEAPLTSKKNVNFSSTFVSRKAIVIPETKVMDNIIKTKRLIDKAYFEEIKVQPRPDKKYVNGRFRPKTPWDVRKSVFKEYRQDNYLLLEKAFENDWNISKVERMLKTSQEKLSVKEYMRSVYKPM